MINATIWGAILCHQTIAYQLSALCFDDVFGAQAVDCVGAVYYINSLILFLTLKTNKLRNFWLQIKSFAALYNKRDVGGTTRFCLQRDNVYIRRAALQKDRSSRNRGIKGLKAGLLNVTSFRKELHHQIEGYLANARTRLRYICRGHSGQDSTLRIGLLYRVAHKLSVFYSKYIVLIYLNFVSNQIS